MGEVGLTTLTIGVRETTQPVDFALAGNHARELVAASDTMSVPSIAYEYMRPAPGSVSLWGVRDMGWFRPTLEAMVDLHSRSSAPDWETEKIRYSAMHAMLNVLANTLDSQTPPPAIVPTWEGGLQAEWHRNGVDLEIEVGPDREAEYYFFSESEEIESPVWNDIPRLIRCVRALRQARDNSRSE